MLTAEVSEEHHSSFNDNQGLDNKAWLSSGRSPYNTKGLFSHSFAWLFSPHQTCNLKSSALQQAEMVPGGLCKPGTKPINSREVHWPSINPQSDNTIGHHYSSPGAAEHTDTRHPSGQSSGWSPLVLFSHLIITECYCRVKELKSWSYYPLLCSPLWQQAVARTLHVLF